MTAPVASGFSIHERMKRISSSRRRVFLAMLKVECGDIWLMTRGHVRRSIDRASLLTGIGPRGRGQASSRGTRATAQPVEKLLDLTKKSGGFGMRVLRRQALEFHQQFSLPFGQLLWRLDHDLNVHVAGLLGAQDRHALALQTEAPTRLRPFGNFHPGLAAVDHRNLEVTAERGRHHRDRNAAMQVGPVALEEFVRRDGQEDVEIASGTTAHARLAFAGQTNPRAILDARRNVDRERAFARNSPGARTGRAWIFDHLASPLTSQASALEREEALGMADAADAPAGGTGLGSGARLGAAARTDLAGDGRRQTHLRGLSVESLLERDLHVVA